jgi:uncharacterized protein (DUF305 family)
MFRFLSVIILLAMLCTGAAAWAQAPQGMPGMSAQSKGMPGMSQPPPAASSSPAAADKDLMSSMDGMNKAMASAPMTGDIDQDFVAMMIPHHQGAIDMCKVELAEGKDAILKKLCRAVIAAQAKEIAMMQHWQRQHPAQH